MIYTISDALDSMQKLVENYGIELDYYSLQLIRDELGLMPEQDCKTCKFSKDCNKKLWCYDYEPEVKE